MKTHTKHFCQLTGFQIKLIALITMTIDHVGAYQTFTFNRTVNDGLCVVGRIAAPLFLFMTVEGLRHTRNKPKYILRLYIAGIAIEITNRIIVELTGSPNFDNTLPMLFYTAFFAFCIESIAKHRKNIKAACIACGALMIPFVFYALHVILTENGFGSAWIILSIFFPSPLNVSYSILFVIMGIAWYFFNNKAINCALFALLSLVCKMVPATAFFAMPSGWLSPVFFSAFGLFIDTQWCMCLAIPFMILYNGKKGRSLKYFFYLYYPLHVYLLFFIRLIRTI